MDNKKIFYVVLIFLSCVICAFVEERTDFKLIVKFENGISRDKAIEKIENAGATMVKIVSEERNTYLAKCKTLLEYKKAIQTLQKDEDVTFVEKENIYTTQDQTDSNNN